MDMEMPEMDGVTATRHIREREDREGTPRLPIVAMTANALREDKERCLAAGMDGYIAKPISRKALQDELFRLFAGTSPPLPAGVAAVEPAKEAAVAGPNESVNKPVFDHAAALERIGDAEVLQNVAAMFVASAPTDIRALEAALATGDWLALRRVAHTLKGLFATFAASDGEQAARELELCRRVRRRRPWRHLCRTDGSCARPCECPVRGIDTAYRRQGAAGLIVRPKGLQGDCSLRCGLPVHGPAC